MQNFFDTNPEDYLEYGFCYRSAALSHGRACREAKQAFQPKKKQIYADTDDMFYLCAKIRKCGAALIVFSLLMSFRLIAALLEYGNAALLPVVYIPALIGALSMPVTRWFEKRRIRQQQKNMAEIYRAEVKMQSTQYSQQQTSAGIPSDAVRIDVLHDQTWHDDCGMTMTNTEMAVWRSYEMFCLMDAHRELIWRIPIREISDGGILYHRFCLLCWHKVEPPCKGWLEAVPADECRSDRPPSVSSWWTDCYPNRAYTGDTPYEVYGLECDACNRVFLPSCHQLKIGHGEQELVLMIPDYDIDAVRRIL